MEALGAKSKFKTNIISLIARPSTDTDIIQKTTEAESDRRKAWPIDVYLNEQLAATEVQLRDPLGPEEERDVRWYVEQYAQKSPYSVTRARKAIKALDGYAEAIIDQLQLVQLLNGRPSNGFPGNEIVSIRVSEASVQHGGSSNSTVHQLHWELLEDPRWWGEECRDVVVERWTRPLEQPPTTINRVKPWSDPTGSSNSINVLLVIARDISRNPAVYNDIDPSVASNILARICQNLKQNPNSVDLNVEIVRPGTLSALEEHLERSEVKRGPGFFHLVHFDLHGSVSSRQKGPKRAYLYFSSPDSDETRPEQASEVAVLLKRYRIPFVVLNACESAKANYGDSANIAKVFESQGVLSVLAMSFEISGSAAEHFMKVFYRKLLIDRLSFSAAASSARAMLRNSSTRRARFGLQIPLLDFFVPVLYSSGEVSIFAVEPTAAAHVENVDDEIAVEAQQHSGFALRGRDFDLLRIEKMLLSQHVIYLHGVAGVGKSAMLSYARSLWNETAFVDSVIYVDLEKGNLQSVEDFANTMLRQLMIPHETEGAVADSVGKPKHLPSNLADCGLDMILQTLAEQRVVLIFDGLHVSYSVFGGDVVPGCLSELAAADIGHFLQTLINAARTTLQQTYIVFTSRRADTVWFSRHTGVEFESSVNAYHLHGLSTANAIELAQTILRRDGHNVDKWGHSELNHLELVVGVLQGIPAALLEVLPWSKTWNVPWLDFHDFIVAGLQQSKQEEMNLASGMMREIMHMGRVLPLHIAAPLMMLSLYWHEGPFRSSFTDMMVAQRLCADKSKIDLMFQLAEERGFVELGPYDTVYWIHPQFTINMRRWALSNKKARRATPPSSMLGSLIQRVSSLLLTSDEVDRASQIMLSSLTARSAPSHLQRPQGFLRPLLQEMNTRSIMLTMMDGLRGIDYEQMASRYGRGLQNLLFCINICIAAGEELSLGDWPMDFFYVYTANIRMIGTTAVAIHFADRYEQLLQRFMRRIGGTAIEPKYQLFALVVTNYLAAAHQVEVPLPTRRYSEFVQLAMEIISASEREYGPITDPTVLIQKSLAYRYKTFWNLENRLPEEATRSWEDMLKIDNLCMSALEGQNEKDRESRAERVGQSGVLETLESALSVDDAGASTMKQRLAHIQRHSLMKVYSKNREGASDLVKAVARQINHLDDEHPEELLDALDQQSFGLAKVAQVSEDSGFTGLENDTRWWPNNFDLVAHLGKFKDPLERLLAIEAAGDSGNWVEAAMHHHALIIEAMEEFDLDEVVEHVNALERIYEGDPLFATPLAEIKIQKQTITALRTLQQALFAVKNPSDGTAKQMINALDGVIDTMGSSQVPEENVRILEMGRDIWNREIDRDEPGFLKSIANVETDTRNNMRKLLKLMRKRYQNQDFFKEFLAEILKVVTTYQQIYNAEISGDFDTALRLIDHTEEISHTELGQILLDAEEIKRHRDKDERKDVWNKTVRAWEHCGLMNDYMGARACIKEMEEQRRVEADEGKEEVTSSVSNLRATTEILHWNKEFALATESMILDNAEAVRHYDVLLELHDEGGFSSVEPGNILAAKSNRLLALINQAFSTETWEQGIAYADEWISLNGADLTTDPHAHDHVKDIRESYILHKHNSRVEKADGVLQFDEALRHLDGLYELLEYQQRTPGVMRKVSTKLTREMLDDIKAQLTMKKGLMDTLGNTMGRAMILRSRASMGYKTTYRATSGI